MIKKKTNRMQVWHRNKKGTEQRLEVQLKRFRKKISK